MCADQLYSATVQCIQEACKDLKSPADQIQAIGIANQRETTIVWDKISGKPLYNAIVWLDTRTQNWLMNLSKRHQPKTRITSAKDWPSYPSLLQCHGSTGTSVLCLEGAGSIGGNAVHFLKDNLHFFEEDSDVEQLAGSVSTTNDLYFIPAFSGLYSPYWDASARGTICGLTLNSTSAHICLATLKAIAFQTAELVEAVENDFEKLNSKIDGGMTKNHLFNQLQADALCKIIECAKLSEISDKRHARCPGLLKFFHTESLCAGGKTDSVATRDT
uniref:Glycerol kinase n=1 Tax=Ditylenchus dipsaci TaxID=166011 RepID=A0A915CW03_9BILA